MIYVNFVLLLSLKTCTGHAAYVRVFGTKLPCTRVSIGRSLSIRNVIVLPSSADEWIEGPEKRRKQYTYVRNLGPRSRTGKNPFDGVLRLRSPRSAVGPNRVITNADRRVPKRGHLKKHRQKKKKHRQTKNTAFDETRPYVSTRSRVCAVEFFLRS